MYDRGECDATPWAPRPRRHVLLIDGHVHLRRCIPLEVALDAAVDNLRRAGAEPAQGEPAGALWLVEAAGEASLARFADLGSGRWRRRALGPASWEVARQDGANLLVVAGHQVVTAEDLEVLVVGTTERPADGETIDATIEPWLDGETLVMLPWGLGKWSGARGRVVARCLSDYGTRGLRLADTAARPIWLRPPSILRREAEAGREVFHGSDPFPFPEAAGAVGSAGFVLEGLDGLDWPAMHHAVRCAGPLPRFGDPMGTLPFLRLQARMQLRKRTREGASG